MLDPLTSSHSEVYSGMRVRRRRNISTDVKPLALPATAKKQKQRSPQWAYSTATSPILLPRSSRTPSRIAQRRPYRPPDRGLGASSRSRPSVLYDTDSMHSHNVPAVLEVGLDDDAVGKFGHKHRLPPARSLPGLSCPSPLRARTPRAPLCGPARCL
mgnify:CR=1 FL=1